MRPKTPMAAYRTDVVRASDWVRLPALVAGLKLSTALIRRAPDGQRRIFDVSGFGWTAGLRARWREIRDEASAVLARPEDLPRMQEVIPGRYTVQQEWKTFFLYGYGRKVARNCERCPATTAAIETVPGMRTALFSVLPPRTRLPPHVGIYRGILRYHLGLIVPDAERCGLRIEDQVLRWREGDDFVFCDQYEHEAWNDTDEYRTILFLDFLRPLPRPLHRLNAWVVRAISDTRFIRESEERLERFHSSREGAA